LVFTDIEAICFDSVPNRAKLLYYNQDLWLSGRSRPPTTLQQHCSVLGSFPYVHRYFWDGCRISGLMTSAWKRIVAVVKYRARRRRSLLIGLLGALRDGLSVNSSGANAKRSGHWSSLTTLSNATSRDRCG